MSFPALKHPGELERPASTSSGEELRFKQNLRNCRKQGADLTTDAVLSIDARTIKSDVETSARRPACRTLPHRDRHSLLSRVIGSQHERKRAPVVGGIAGRRLAAIERGEEGFHELGSG